MSRHQFSTANEFLESATLSEHPEDAMNAREIFIQDQNCCCLCGEQLSFDHVIDFMQLTVIESAECDACKIKLRKRLFTLN